MDDLTVVDVEIADFVATVTLNSPPVNACSPALMSELTLAFDRLSDRDDVRAVVLAANGKVFCAGADIKARAGLVPQAGDHWQGSRLARETFYSIMECKKPVVAAIQGPALGAGLGIAASADILIAGEAGSLGLPEINVGLLGGGRHAMRLFGHSLTRRMMFTGYRVPASELYRLGVVEQVVPTEETLDAAKAMAADIASKSPIAMMLAKHALNAIEEMSLRDGYRFEQSMTGELGKYEDSKEAMKAFAEKRAPVFKGR